MYMPNAENLKDKYKKAYNMAVTSILITPVTAYVGKRKLYE